MDLTDQAMVGLNVNEVAWIYGAMNDYGPITKTELEEMYFKLKIYACDIDPNPFIADFSCTDNSRQKCSRLIFVWTHGGRGINFMSVNNCQARVLVLVQVQ